MSRGLGRLQRALLAELERVDHASAQDLAEQVFGRWPPSDSQYSATRRALQTLKRRGLVAEMLWRYRHEWTDAPPSAQKHYVLETKAAEQHRQFMAELRSVRLSVANQHG